MTRPVLLIVAGIAWLAPQALDAPPLPPSIRVAAVQTDPDRFEHDRYCPNTDNALRVEGAAIRDASALLALRKSHPHRPIIVRDGDLSGGRFAGARLHDVCFIGTKLAGSDWREADAPRLGLVFADLTGATLMGARMPAVRIQQPHLKGVDATGADFSDGELSGNAFGSWAGLRLDRANLRRFRFRCGTTQSDQCVANQSARAISFREADLGGAQIDTYWGETDWAGARFDETTVDLRQLLEIAAARVLGPLIVREGEVTVRLSPAEFAALRPHLSKRPSLAAQDDNGGERTSLKPGATALFIAPPIRVDPSAPEHLTRRLLPVAVRAATAAIVVTAADDGTLAAEGDAVGGNAHLCGLSAHDLRFDADSGWFEGRPDYRTGGSNPGLGERIPLLRFRGHVVEVHSRGHSPDLRALDFVLCGARAGFDPMVRVDVAPGAVAHLREVRTRGRRVGY